MHQIFYHNLLAESDSFWGETKAKEIEAKNKEIAQARCSTRHEFDTPQEGDFLRLANGEFRRVAHKWEEDDIQPTCSKCGLVGGSFFLGSGGHSTMSGSLDDAIKAEFVDSGETKMGRFWFPSLGNLQAHCAINIDMPVKVWDVREKKE